MLYCPCAVFYRPEHEVFQQRFHTDLLEVRSQGFIETCLFRHNHADSRFGEFQYHNGGARRLH